MEKGLSRRKFLERVGLGTAAGMSLSLLNELAEALPAAGRKNLGVIAMKVTGQEFLLGGAAGKADIDSLLHYSMSLPVTAAVVGMPHIKMLEHNIAVARSFSPLKEDEMERLRHALSPSREGLEHKLIGHLDGPTTTPHAFFA